MKRQSAVAAGDAGWTLKTVLREHRLGADGLLAGAKSKGDEIFAAPFTFRAKVNGKRERFAAERFDVLETRPNGVRLRAAGRFGTMRFTADVVWDYDGFALVTGTMSPAARTTIEELTIVAPLKKAEATLYHALVDMTRGNEFTPYVWFGGEEKGLALLFDSPKGYDLEDGKPMVRIVRAADRVTCECDVVSRAHALAKPMTFQFGYQVTPVKPLQAGSELWVPQYGNRLPGMVHISPIVTGANFGLYPQGFLKTPPNTNNWIQAKAFRKAMRTRRIDYKALEYMHGEGDRQTAEWAERNKDLYARSYHKSGDTFRRHLLLYQHDQLTRDAMTLDRAIVYSCATLFSNTADDAYNYYRAEWYTDRPRVSHAGYGGLSDLDLPRPPEERGGRHQLRRNVRCRSDESRPFGGARLQGARHPRDRHPRRARHDTAVGAPDGRNGLQGTSPRAASHQYDDHTRVRILQHRHLLGIRHLRQLHRPLSARLLPGAFVRPTGGA